MKSDVIRIAICDDEKVIAEKIKKYVEDYINKTELPYIIEMCIRDRHKDNACGSFYGLQNKTGTKKF